MAKKKATRKKATPSQPAAAATEPQPVQGDAVKRPPTTLTMPGLIRRPPGGYRPQHVELRLTQAQSEACSDLWFTLMQEKQCDVPLNRPIDAIRWLLNRVAEQKRAA